MKRFLFFTAVLFIAPALLRAAPALRQDTAAPHIQVVFLLDVSGSMQGLITQACSQLWITTNELAKAERKGRRPVVEYALATYGNSGYADDNYFLLNVPFTTDIDLLADSMFSLRTSGDHELCGQALQNCVDRLTWSKRKTDLRVIFIAGNETFGQGPKGYREACAAAVKKDILVNAIYCGTEVQAEKDLWPDAAKRGNGMFAVINKDSVSKLMETMWDKKIIAFNRELNATYVPYGPDGEKKRLRQERIDENARRLGGAFMRNRVILKADSSYSNESWDLVDAWLADSLILDKLSPADLPAQLEYLSPAERKAYLQKAADKREVCKDGIRMYCEKAAESLRASDIDPAQAATLDIVLVTMLKAQAKEKGFVFKND